MAQYTAPRILSTVFNPSDFNVVITKITSGSQTHSYDYWLNAFATVNNELTSLNNQLLNIGTNYSFTQIKEVDVPNAVGVYQYMNVGGINGIVLPLKSGTSTYPMAFFNAPLIVNTNNTDLYMGIGYNTSGVLQQLVSWNNANTQNMGVMLSGAITDTFSIFAYQVNGSNSALVSPCSQGVINCFYVYIK